MVKFTKSLLKFKPLALLSQSKLSMDTYIVGLNLKSEERILLAT